MKMIFSRPVELHDHFSIPFDETEWNPAGHHRTAKQGWTPTRDRATFRSHANGLRPKTDFGHKLSSLSGLYVLAFDCPERSLYIGIAADDSDAPEGVLSRIRKHRVKATGSHVGGNPDSVGGVHHPEAWRNFAAKRAAAFRILGQSDNLSDVRLIIGQLESQDTSLHESSDGKVRSETGRQTKAELERFESYLVSDHQGVRTKIQNLLWSDPHDSVRLLTSGFRKIAYSDTDEMHLW